MLELAVPVGPMEFRHITGKAVASLAERAGSGSQCAGGLVGSPARAARIGAGGVQEVGAFPGAKAR